MKTATSIPLLVRQWMIKVCVIALAGIRHSI